MEQPRRRPHSLTTSTVHFVLSIVGSCCSLFFVLSQFWFIPHIALPQLYTMRTPPIRAARRGWIDAPDDDDNVQPQRRILFDLFSIRMLHLQFAARRKRTMRGKELDASLFMKLTMTQVTRLPNIITIVGIRSLWTSIKSQRCETCPPRDSTIGIVLSRRSLERPLTSDHAHA